MPPEWKKLQGTQCWVQSEQWFYLKIEQAWSLGDISVSESRESVEAFSQAIVMLLCLLSGLA